jgi:CDP-6-deoxy-D-xylo-4-hexulose-3-dehydrase
LIKLINDTINQNDLDALSEWIKTNPRLTKGKLTTQFEQEFSNYIQCHYSAFVNSGSSANLLMASACKIYYDIKSVIIPSIAWATTVSPFMQLGYSVKLCKVKRDLTINPEGIRKGKHIIMTVNPLGVPCDMNELISFCKSTGSIFLEDNCESLGSEYLGVKAGNFGEMSSFSFYYGHHISTIEGGMVCTNNRELYEILLMLRSHGWDRDISSSSQKKLRNKYKVSDFRSRFTMYLPAYNLRSTDLQAFIGLRQIKKLNYITMNRQRNYLWYDKYLNNNYWKLSIKDSITAFSNFAYPVIHPNIKNIIKALEGKVDTRPLI